MTAALALEYAFLPFSVCSVAEPCLPTPWWSLLEGLLLGATVAAWLTPGTGLPLAGLATLPFVLDYAVLGELGTVAGAAALAQLVVGLTGSWLVWSQRRRRLPDTRSGRLPLHGRDVLASRGVGTMELSVLVALAVVVGLIGWFLFLGLDTRAHLSRAQPTAVEVVAVDDYDWLLEVRVPGVAGASDVGVYDVKEFAVGDLVPARVDTTVQPAWVSLDTQPVEHDGWLVLAGVAAALSITVGADRASALRRRHRLLTVGGPVWSTTATPGGDGLWLLLPELGLRAPLVRALPPDELLEGLGLLRHEVTADPLGREPVDEPAESVESVESEEAERLRQEEFAAAWRGNWMPESDLDDDLDDDLDEFRDFDERSSPVIEPVLIVGDPRAGGMVVAITPDVVLAPHGPLLPMSPFDSRRLAAATDRPDEARARRTDHGSPEAEPDVDAAGLPGSVAVPLPAGAEPRGQDGRRVEEIQLALPRWRKLAALALLLLPGAFWLTADASLPPEEQLTWFQSVGVLFGAGSAAFGGLAFARASTRLRADGVHSAAHEFVVVQPWQDVVGVRVIDGDVVVAFGVDDDGDLDALGGPPLRLGTAVAAGLAATWHAAAADQDAPPARRAVDPLVGGGVVLYALAAGGSVLWPVLSVAQ
ncbi:hypothetical protein [Jannaschia sp. R86511]|uniref:hypothetical protein n=1 Tax=Jannaschia sp. R86511 TaxID=3093853 RepID=UPI0036D345D5